MPHSVTLITTIAVAFGLALAFGFVAVKLRLPALVGYLFAGILIGPATPGFVADVDIASQLAEIGVMLLMFGVGLHFSLGDLLSVKRVALPGAVVQMGVATALGAGITSWWGWSIGAALVFGLALSVASTVVLLKALESRHLLDTVNGKIAVGWLIVEDLAMVLVLVLLPALAGVLDGAGGTAQGWSSLWWPLAKTLLEVAAFVALMLIGGRRGLPWLLWQVTRTGSRELFTLCVIAAAVSIAVASSALFGVSFALGAFFAGMVLRESEFSHRAAEETLPLRDAFAVLFFVSVGMLFDPRILIDAPLRVLTAVAIIVVGKSAAAIAIVLLLRYPLSTALTVSAGLAQIGEFSFILIGLGASLGLLPPEGRDLVLAGALISIAINPLVFAAMTPAWRWVRARPELARKLERIDDPLAELPMSTDRKYLSNQVVLVGYGRVGRKLAHELRERGIPFVVADENRDLVNRLRAEEFAAVCGDAREPATLIQAHIAQARMLVITTPDTIDARKMIEIARRLNAQIEVVVSGQNEEEAMLLEREGLAVALIGEHELAKAMTTRVIARIEALKNEPLPQSL